MLNMPLSFQITIQLKGDEGELYTPNQLSIRHHVYLSHNVLLNPFWVRIALIP